ncbi:MAG: autotransporter outer membrane beta-barrel domain-containing protein [Pseudomonadota bacterium]
MVSSSDRGEDGQRGGFRRTFTRFAILIATIVVLGAAFAEQAAAQCSFSCGPPPSPTPPAASSGNPNLSASSTITDLGSQFLQRFNAISSYRTAASANNNPQGGGADEPAERYRAWLEGYGVAARTSAQGDFSGDKRRTWGGIAGIAATVAPGWTLGLSVDQSSTKVDITGFPQSGRIDLTQVGVNGAYETGNWIFGGAFVFGSGRVHSSRSDGTGEIRADYGAKLYGLLGEASYYIALPNNSRIVPRVGADWTYTQTGAFTETGTANAVTAGSVATTRARVTAGAEIGHSWLADRKLFDVAVYGRFVDNVVQNIGALNIDNTTGGSAPRLINGVRESNYGADAGAMASVKITQMARLYTVYDGRFRGNFTSHTGTAGVEVRW